jgi:hypothetical protein
MADTGKSAGSGLDALARDLATGAISRRTALRRFAGVSLGALIAGPVGLFSTESASASCPKARRCNGKCCPNHAHCHHGKCKCNTGFTRCGKKCRNLLTDEKNCGSCGHQCAAGKICRNGHCKAVPATCIDGIQNEGETDVDCGGPNCAGCANGKACLIDTDCQSGHCVSNVCRQCGEGLTNCGGNCVDIQTDVDNCGGCSQVCFVEHGIASCVSGTCQVESCDQGFADCNSNPSDGCETALGTNTDCSGCGAGCTAPQTCGGGGSPNVCGCTPTCPACVNSNVHSNGCGGFCAKTCSGNCCDNVCTMLQCF